MSELRQSKHGRRRWLWLILAAVAVALGLGWRWVATMSVGTGETRVSPDGRFTASAMEFSDRHFVTGEARRWFEFRVTGPGLDYRYEGTPLPGPYFGSRSSHSVVRWEADSSAVRFVFPNAELRFAVTPKEAIR